MSSNDNDGRVADMLRDTDMRRTAALTLHTHRDTVLSHTGDTADAITDAITDAIIDAITDALTLLHSHDTVAFTALSHFAHTATLTSTVADTFASTVGTVAYRCTGATNGTIPGPIRGRTRNKGRERMLSWRYTDSRVSPC